MLGKLLRGGSVQPLVELPLTFRLPVERQLTIPHEYDAYRAWRFLSHHVSRYPQDLRAHTQRVLLCQQEPLSQFLAGSLQDVFIALQGAGRLLRERLFARVNASLTEPDRMFFQGWLDAEDHQAFQGKWHEGSLLSTGDGSIPQRLIKVERVQEQAAYSNVMDEVLACLEYGQVDDACVLLEQEAAAGRMDEAMEQELLNIYQYTRNKEGLGNMIKRIQEAGKEVPAAWLEMQQASEQW